jgi:hypothetical protein
MGKYKKNHEWFLHNLLIISQTYHLIKRIILQKDSPFFIFYKLIYYLYNIKIKP